MLALMLVAGLVPAVPAFADETLPPQSQLSQPVDEQAVLTVPEIPAPAPATPAGDAIVPLSPEETVTIYMTFEGYNLGQGYLIEPMRFEVPADWNVARATDALLNELGIGYQNTGTIDSGFYLSQLNLPNRPTHVGGQGGVVFPDYILNSEGGDEVPDEGLIPEDSWLGEFHYYYMSGWMLTVNNFLINKGTSDWAVEEGAVVRWQFTVKGYGADLGLADSGGWGEDPYYSQANKDALIRALFATDATEAAKQAALAVAVNPLSTETQVSEVISALLGGALPQPDKTALQSAINAAAQLVQSEYTAATWAPFADALRAAQEVYGNAEATQAEVSTAASELTAKQGALQRIVAQPPNKTALVAAVAAAEALVATDYLSSTWEPFAAALGIAKGVVANTGATQKQVDDALAELNKKKVALVRPNVEPADVATPLYKVLAYLPTMVPEPQFGTIAGEWSVFSLARGNAASVSQQYYDDYYGRMVALVQSVGSSKLHDIKSTENSRLILALSAIGRDARDVGGYNLLEPYADFNWVKMQGINGPAYALIALDTNGYEFPLNASVSTQTTRGVIIDFLLGREIGKGTPAAGGWALSGKNPDPDVTAFVLQALTPYYNDPAYPAVAAAVDRGVSKLSAIQGQDGGYTTFGDSNSESCVQVIVALSGLGIDAQRDGRFVKPGGNPVTAMLRHQDASGGFRHVLNGSVDGMATDQGAYGLVAYSRFLKGSNRLYDMRDAFAAPESPEAPTVSTAALAQAVALAKALDAARFTAQSWAGIAAALEAASALLVNPAATQEQVDGALVTLMSALNKRVEVANKESLKQAITTASALDSKQYTPATWTPLVTALDGAKKVQANETASQTQVDTALTALISAIGSLALAPNDDKVNEKGNGSNNGGTANSGNGIRITGSTSQGGSGNSASGSGTSASGASGTGGTGAGTGTGSGSGFTTKASAAASDSLGSDASSIAETDVPEEPGGWPFGLPLNMLIGITMIALAAAMAIALLVARAVRRSRLQAVPVG
jgi:hypothetical protein